MSRIVPLCRVLYQGVASGPGVYPRHTRDMVVRRLIKFATPGPSYIALALPFHHHRSSHSLALNVVLLRGYQGLCRAQAAALVPRKYACHRLPHILASQVEDNPSGVAVRF